MDMMDNHMSTEGEQHVVTLTAVCMREKNNIMTSSYMIERL